MAETIRDLTAVAIAYVRARMRARDLKRRRNAMVCEHQSEDLIEPGDGIGPLIPVVTGTPCWQQTEMVGGSYYEPPEPRPIPEEDYCDKCKERQRLHREYHKAARERGAAYRKLENRVKKEVADG